jgi:hypothetical protein
LPGEPAYPDQGLPAYPDQGLPPSPPGVWPPPTVSHPIVPAPPDTPPGTIWPSPGVPTHPIQPGSPGVPTHPIEMPSSVHWMLCYAPNLGWKFVAVDPSLTPTPPIAPTPAPK